MATNENKILPGQLVQWKEDCNLKVVFPDARLDKGYDMLDYSYCGFPTSDLVKKYGKPTPGHTSVVTFSEMFFSRREHDNVLNGSMCAQLYVPPMYVYENKMHFQENRKLLVLSQHVVGVNVCGITLKSTIQKYFLCLLEDSESPEKHTYVWVNAAHVEPYEYTTDRSAMIKHRQMTILRHILANKAKR